MQSVALSIGVEQMVAERFGGPVGLEWRHRRALVLGCRGRPTEDPGGRGLEQARLRDHAAYLLEQPREGDSAELCGPSRVRPGVRAKGHGGEVVDLVRFEALEDLSESWCVHQVCSNDVDPVA